VEHIASIFTYKAVQTAAEDEGVSVLSCTRLYGVIPDDTILYADSNQNVDDYQTIRRDIPEDNVLYADSNQYVDDYQTIRRDIPEDNLYADSYQNVDDYQTIRRDTRR
jgi:hypothetical protein